MGCFSDAHPERDSSGSVCLPVQIAQMSVANAEKDYIAELSSRANLHEQNSHPLRRPCQPGGRGRGGGAARRVVRELVENSLDAGATQVEVHVQRGGAAFIRVADNGLRHGPGGCADVPGAARHQQDPHQGRSRRHPHAGLPRRSAAEHRERVALSPRHARTEALSGTEIEVNGGKMQTVRDDGGAPGTMVEARSLFFNLPARRKFLRTEATEMAHVEQQFRLHAIAQSGDGLHAGARWRSDVPASGRPAHLISRIEGLAGANWRSGSSKWRRSP